MEKLVIIGAGGHGKTVCDSAEASKEFVVMGFVDDYKTGNHYGKPIIANDVEQIPNRNSYVYHVAIGNNRVRKAIYDRLIALGLKVRNVVDPTAVVSKTAFAGEGNYIGKNAVIDAGCIIGSDNIINTAAILAHDVMIGNHVNVSTNATLNGDVIVEDGAFIGSCAASNGQLKVGRWATVGSGAVIIHDVAEETTVVGVPAKEIRSTV